MAKAKKSARIPGDTATTDEGAADVGAVDTVDAGDEVVVTSGKKPKLEATSALPPAIKEAVARADKMTYADAKALDDAGALPRRTLTEKGWYIPDANRKIG